MLVSFSYSYTYICKIRGSRLMHDQYRAMTPRLHAFIITYYILDDIKNLRLYSHGAGYRYFKNSSTVNLDLFCRKKAVAPPNKKIIIIRRIWRFSGVTQFH